MTNRYFFPILLTVTTFITYCSSETDLKPAPADLIANEIKTHLSDQKYLRAIIEGIEASSRNVEVSTEEYQAFLTADLQIRQWKAQQNLVTSERWMLEKANEENISTIIPYELFYRVIKEGSGRTLENDTARVKINYLILKFNDQFPESCDKKQVFELSHLIPGLTKGMVAMKVGEIRKIYIHPKYAYANSNTFEPNCALEVTIELLDILPSKVDAASLEPLPATQHPVFSDNHLEESLTKKHYVIGWRLWSHLKYGYHLFNKEELLEALKKEKSFKVSPEMDEKINHIHWLIYQQRIQDQDLVPPY